MLKLDLKYNNAYNWVNDKKIYFIGYIFYNEKFYWENQALELIRKNEKNIKKFILEVDGCFSILIKCKDKVIIISDMLRTFPIFYKISDKDIKHMEILHEYIPYAIALDEANSIEKFIAQNENYRNLIYRFSNRRKT